MAKLEVEIAIAAFAERLRDPELDEDSLIYRSNVAVRGPESMVVNFKP